MKKYIPLIIIVGIMIVLVVGVIVLFNSTKRTVDLPKENIFFYSETCPHCRNVENFATANNVKEKFIYSEKEITSAANNKLFHQISEYCGIALKNRGVPLFWDGSTCLVGEDKIIELYTSKIK